MFFSCRRMICAALLCAATAVGAQTVNGDVVELMHGPAFRTFVYEDMALREYVMEMTRRAMLLGRCAVFNESKGFPGKSAPKMAAVMETTWRWAVRGSADSVSGPRALFKDAAMKDASILLDTVLSPRQLQNWSRFRASERGARGLEVAALVSGVAMLPEKIMDPASGISVGWPLATVRHMADDLHLRAQLDAAFDALRPGTSARLNQFSAVMGEGPQPEPDLVDLLMQEDASSRLVTALTEHLSKADQAALRALQNQPVWQRWAGFEVSYGKLMSHQRILMEKRVPTPKELCEALELHCQPDVLDAMEQAREDRLRAPEFSEMKKFLRQMPEAGCPLP